MPHVISKITRSQSTIYLAKLYINSDQYCIFVVSVSHVIEMSLTENNDGNEGLVKKQRRIRKKKINNNKKIIYATERKTVFLK